MKKKIEKLLDSSNIEDIRLGIILGLTYLKTYEFEVMVSEKYINNCYMQKWFFVIEGRCYRFGTYKIFRSSFTRLELLKYGEREITV